MQERKLKILIYLGHPAHFYNYKNTIYSLKNAGHTVFILIKKKDILEDLLKEEGLPYYNILIQGRADSKFGIIQGTIVRAVHLFQFCIKYRPDILTGTSVENSIIGKLLGIPVININEDDASVVPLYAKMSYPWATEILNPRVCNSAKWDTKAIKYESYHELAYLHPNHFKPDPEVVTKYFNPDEKYFLIRFAKLTAHHDEGIRGINSIVAANIIDILKPFGNVYITSERKLEPQFEKYRIKINPIDMHHVMAFAELYIGDSQTMAAEAGVLGVPFIRFNDFVDRIGYLDELEKHYHLGFGIKANNYGALYLTLKTLLAMPDRKEVFAARRDKMLADKIDFAQFLTWFLGNYPVSAKIMKENPGVQYSDFQQNGNNLVTDYVLKNSVVNKPVVRDFSLQIYRELLVNIKKQDFSFFTFQDFCENKAKGKYVILRHDVDLKAIQSLYTAQIEASLGIRATYYFRYIPQSNKPEIIRQIAQLGHEIGYHYEEMSIFNGNLEKSIVFFEKQLNYFRQFYPVKTISMHGSPFSKWDNKLLWDRYNYRDFDVIGEPYFEFLDMDKHNHKDIYYFTDTGRMWNGDKYNVRDKMKVSTKSTVRINVHSTNDLMCWFESAKENSQIMITTHPQRWTDNFFEWIFEYVFQSCKNKIKQLISKK